MPEVPQGVVPGGWSYVIAAYSITAGVLLVYTLSLFSRLKKASKEDSK